MKLLLAEDEKELSHALTVILEHNKYEVTAAYDGTAALERGLEKCFDAIILDIMMPGIDGIEVLKSLRHHGIVTPVLMLTAKAEVDDRIVGLTSGADDYLTKPFAMGELLARIQAMTRRKEEYMPDILDVGNVCLDREALELYTDRSCFRLSNQEFKMMELFFSNAGRSINTSQIIEKVWGSEEKAGTDAVSIYLSYLQKKLRAVGANVQIEKEEEGYSLKIVKQEISV